MTGGAPARRRVVGIADADSYVKWTAAFLDTAVHSDVHLLLVRTPLTVSAAQEDAARSGTRVRADQTTRLDHADLAAWLDADQPDVVVIAGRGPFVRLVQREIDRLARRPVVVAGMPGMSIPAQRGAVLYRRHADLMVVHSLRERRAFGELSARLAAPLEFGLAPLPFAAEPPAETTAPTGTDLVFAAQAIVPREPGHRRLLAQILRQAALARPDRRVVIKLRSRAALGESETHFETLGFPELLADRPANLVFSYEPMHRALDTAEGLVTVSSTAAIEAVSRGIPVIALDIFGIDKEHLNTVFRGSGLFGSAEDVIHRRFRHPAPTWMQQNYFHDGAWNDAWVRIDELVAQRRAGTLPARTVGTPRGGRLRLAWDRKAVLGAEDRTLSGALALAAGRPLVAGILALRRLRPSGAAGAHPDDTADVTVATAKYQDPIVRRRRSGRVSPA